MVEWIGIKKDGAMWPASEDDKKVFDSLQDGMVENKSKGAKKKREYKQLCAYKSSLTYVAESIDISTFKQRHPKADFDNWNTKNKVDTACKIACGFYNPDEFIVKTSICQCGATIDNVIFILKSLAYTNCDHLDACKYISDALDLMGQVLGISSEELLQALSRK